MNPTCFARYMSKYLTEYLPGIQGVSYNTIASKRDAYIHLLKYLDDTQNIKAEDVNIPLLTRETIINLNYSPLCGQSSLKPHSYCN